MKRPILLHSKTWLILLLVLLASASSLYSQSFRWAIVNAKIHHDSPNVARIETGVLADWLKDPKREPPLLLDVRTKAEFDVSHIANAKRVEPGSNPARLDLPKGRPIVTYCSVGYRSSAFAQKLAEAGFKNVSNLEGSIFQWANEGRPIVHDGHPTDKVHSFNGIWGTLLNKSHRAENVLPVR